jgi:hypothetical protein
LRSKIKKPLRRRAGKTDADVEAGGDGKGASSCAVECSESLRISTDTEMNCADRLKFTTPSQSVQERERGKKTRNMTSQVGLEIDRGNQRQSMKGRG